MESTIIEKSGSFRPNSKKKSFISLISCEQKKVQNGRKNRTWSGLAA